LVAAVFSGWAVQGLGAAPARAPASASASASAPRTEPAADDDVKLVDHTTAIAYQKKFPDDDIDAWHKRVPQVEVVEIPSSLDGKKQRVIWYHPGGSRERPLLVALHSWSADYEQNLDIPFAELAIKNEWGFLHPDFRGPNLRPEATASDLAVQDVLDAVDFARKRAAVDASRIYLVGYSGGAMKALVLAGKHPDRWAGVVAWGGIYDIADWYRHRGMEKHYRGEIAASCGGAPRPGSPAEAECRERSPVTYLPQATGRVSVLIAHGLRDTTVPLRHALRTYEALAAPQDRFTDRQRAFIDRYGRVPRELRAGAIPSDPAIGRDFDRGGVPIRLERRSQAVTLLLYEGGHDMVYNASFRWLSQQRRR
jgi:dipeptidyl aminopeptidase/acylaminoacyl peptidase